MKLEKLFDRRERKGYYVFCDYTFKNVRRFALMCKRVYRRAITSTHMAKRVDKVFGEIKEDDRGRSVYKHFATSVKIKVIGKIRWNH